MKHTLITIAIYLITTAPALAQGSFAQLTVSTSAIGIPKPMLTGMSSCVIQVDSGTIRMRSDGVAPTAAIGFEIREGSSWLYNNILDAMNAQFIRSNNGVADATVNISCSPSGSASAPLAGSGSGSTGPAFNGVLVANPGGSAITDLMNLALRVNLIAGQCVGPSVQSIPIGTNVAGLTQLVAATGSTTITVCGWSVHSATLVLVQFVTGTGVNCGTGTINRTGNVSVNAQRSMSPGFGAMLIKGNPGEALCIRLGSADAVAGQLTFTQQ